MRRPPAPRPASANSAAWAGLAPDTVTAQRVVVGQRAHRGAGGQHRGTQPLGEAPQLVAGAAHGDAAPRGSADAARSGARRRRGGRRRRQGRPARAPDARARTPAAASGADRWAAPRRPAANELRTSPRMLRSRHRGSRRRAAAPGIRGHGPEAAAWSGSREDTFGPSPQLWWPPAGLRNSTPRRSAQASAIAVRALNAPGPWSRTRPRAAAHPRVAIRRERRALLVARVVTWRSSGRSAIRHGNQVWMPRDAEQVRDAMGDQHGRRRLAGRRVRRGPCLDVPNRCHAGSSAPGARAVDGPPARYTASGRPSTQVRAYGITRHDQHVRLPASGSLPARCPTPIASAEPLVPVTIASALDSPRR
jgi:hypothetical protein